MNTSEVIQKAILIRDYLNGFMNYEENPIDTELLPVPPFKISNDIRLIIVGQDPTIRQAKQRIKIDTTLNLDKSGALKTYIRKICDTLEIDLENIYATNVFKYFYTHPPSETITVLEDHLKPNLQLLQEEITQYPLAGIITLGEPVLRLLVNSDQPQQQKMVYYWDYDKTTKTTNGHFKYCEAGNNALARVIFPIPHQPSMSKTFYLNTFEEYIMFIKDTIG